MDDLKNYFNKIILSATQFNDRNLVVILKTIFVVATKSFRKTDPGVNPIRQILS